MMMKPSLHFTSHLKRSDIEVNIDLLCELESQDLNLMASHRERIERKGKNKSMRNYSK
jgi:hypothetical protein